MVDFESGATGSRPPPIGTSIGAAELEVRTAPTLENPRIEASTLPAAGKVLESRSSNERRFKRFVAEWKAERDPYSSDPSHDATCISYLKIIGMGPEAIPLILHEMQRRPDHWFAALYALTEANPIKKDHRGIFREIINDWLEWGKKHGYIS